WRVLSEGVWVCSLLFVCKEVSVWVTLWLRAVRAFFIWDNCCWS
ncbi:38315_t:CDS:1, partial [Gigaspora margarita]